MYSPVLRRLARRWTALLLVLAAAGLLLPRPALADSGETVVRVGWYESPFNSTDQLGRRSGYAYEYQRKIASYTGWHYEYVEGNWPELMQMLRRGEIDLLSDVSYTPERAEEMLFSYLPMGTEAYYLFISPDNPDILLEDFSSLNGKRVGVNETSYQRDLFLAWEKVHGVEAEVIELNETKEESLEKLRDGRLDALVTLDAYGDPECAVPLWKIGSSDFYFAVNGSRPDLLQALDTAMSRIQDENIYYNQQMYRKFLDSSGRNLYLTAEEINWLSRHGPIRVGYQDRYLAFCAADEAGELTGALRDVLAYASDSLKNHQLEFQPIAYPTAAEAMEALEQGEVDCVFPANLSDYDGEVMGLLMTPPLMSTEIDAVVRSAEQQSFLRQTEVQVAVNQGNPNYDMFLLDHYPGWNTVIYEDTPACLDAVAAGEADCILISNYRFSNISKQCKKLHLTTVYTGVDIDYCFAVRDGNIHLYSILARITGMVPASTINAALTYFSAEDAKVGPADLLWEYLWVVMSLIAAVLLVIVLLLLRSIRAEQKASEEHHLVDVLNQRVFFDALTSVRNKGAFDEHIHTLQQQADRGGPSDFAIGVFDCDGLKQINDQYGHDKGDAYLKSASRLICQVFQGSPVFRIGGDEFSVILQGSDFTNRDNLVQTFEARREALCAGAEQPWEEVHVSLGIAAYDPETDRQVMDTVRRADKIMYDYKRRAKANRR